jgi:glycosyltransferase involved in cell wall biosynthesis
MLSIECELKKREQNAAKTKQDATRMRVLQMQADFEPATLYVGEQVTRAMLAKGHEVTTVFLRGNPNQLDHLPSGNIECLNLSKSQVKGLARWLSMWSIYKYCRQNRFNIVIAHRFKPIHMFLVINRWLNLPVLGIVHGEGDYDRPYRQKTVKSLVNGDWSFVAVGDSVKRYLLDRGCGFNEDNTTVITNAIDVENIAGKQLSRSAAREALGIDDDDFVFGAIGRLVPVKGHASLIKAFATVAGGHPKAKLAIIGGGRLELELKELVRSLDLEDRVHFIGHVEGASRYVRAFDVFVIPSLSEGTPLALLEAMTGSVPVIGSNIPSLSSALQDAGGFGFEAGNIQGMASVMQSCAKLPAEKLAAMGEQSYRYVCEKHSIENFQHAYQALVVNQLPGWADDSPTKGAVEPGSDI